MMEEELAEGETKTKLPSPFTEQLRLKPTLKTCPLCRRPLKTLRTQRTRTIYTLTTIPS